MENILSNVNTDLLNHILYLKVYKDGESFDLSLLDEMDKHTTVEVTFRCIESAKYKLNAEMNAIMTVEELDIYRKLGVEVC